MSANRSKEKVRARTLVGALESLRCGITKVQDMLDLVPLDESYSEVVIAAYRGWHSRDQLAHDGGRAAGRQGATPGFRPVDVEDMLGTRAILNHLSNMS